MDGGAWYGLPPSNKKAAPDADKTCADSSECTEWCQAPPGTRKGATVTGKCYGGRDHEMICFQAVTEGIAEYAICE